MSERTVRRRVAAGKIEAVKDTSPETGAAYFIAQATVDALLAPAPSPAQLQQGAHKEEEQEEEAHALARVEPLERSVLAAPSAELVRLRDDVQQIKAFLVGQEMAQGSEELPANLGTVIGQAMRETVAPLVERIEQQSAENALLKQQLAQALEQNAGAQAREQERESARKRPSWWLFSRWAK